MMKRPGNGSAGSHADFVCALMPKFELDLLDGTLEGRARLLSAQGDILLLSGTLAEATRAATDAGLRHGDLVRARIGRRGFATWRFGSRRETMQIERAA